MTRVKICGLTRTEDVLIANSLADEVGFVMEPSSPRFVAEVSILQPDPSHGAVTFSVYGPLPSSPTISGLDRVQFIPNWSIPLPDELRGKHRPVLRPTAAADWGLVRAWLEASGSTELALDPFHKDAYGGTGLRLDDSLVDLVQSHIELPLVIAGGLTPSNAADVIKRHRPWGVDVSSGIEIRPGVKDHDLLKAFVDAVRTA